MIRKMRFSSQFSSRPIENIEQLLTCSGLTTTLAFHSSPTQHSKAQRPENPSPSILSIGSPSRIQKLIASQSDPLLAKQIFDLASLQPSFRHSYSAFHTLICKLGRSRYFSQMENLLSRLKSLSYTVSPTLFSDVIRIYGDSKMPHKAIKTFYLMLQFDCKPLPKHLNRLLQVLISERDYLSPAFDIFRLSHKYGF